MVEVASGMTDASPKSSITIHDRLEAGNFTIDEVCVLKRRSRSGFYADAKAWLKFASKGATR